MSSYEEQMIAELQEISQEELLEMWKTVKDFPKPHALQKEKELPNLAYSFVFINNTERLQKMIDRLREKGQATGYIEAFTLLIRMKDKPFELALYLSLCAYMGFTAGIASMERTTRALVAKEFERRQMEIPV